MLLTALTSEVPSSGLGEVLILVAGSVLDLDPGRSGVWLTKLNLVSPLFLKQCVKDKHSSTQAEDNHLTYQ